jgi:hypothetical protein
MAGQTYPITVLGSDFVTPAMAAADPNCVASQLTVSVPTGSVTLSDVAIIDSTKITAIVQPMDTDPAEIATLTLWGAYFGPMVVKAPTRLGAMTKPDVAQARPGPGALAKPAAALPADSGAPPGTESLGQTTAAVLPVPVIKWTDHNNNQPISTADGTAPPTQNAVVGQRINLTTTPTAEDLLNLGFILVPNFGNHTKSWTLDGTIIGGYDVKPTSGLVTQADLAQTVLTSYWVYPSAQSTPFNVNYQYCVFIPNTGIQCSATAKASFLVHGPKGSVRTETQSWEITPVLSARACSPDFPDQRYLQFIDGAGGTICTESAAHPGITFNGSVSNQHSGIGEMFWVQYLSQDVRTITLTTEQNARIFSETGLDNTYPYKATDQYNNAEDSPLQGLDGLNDARLQFTAQMYEMWQSGGKDNPLSVPVPLCFVNWAIDGAASLNGRDWRLRTDTGKADGCKQATDSGTQSHGYPTWTSVVTNTVGTLAQ